MPANPSLQSAFAILRATMERPLGLISVLMFLGGIAAFLIFRDLNPKASVTSFWFVLIGCLGLAYEASQTMRLNPDLTRFTQISLPGRSADVRPSAQSPSSRTHTIGTGGSSISSGSPPPTSSPSSGGSSGSPGPAVASSGVGAGGGTTAPTSGSTATSGSTNAPPAGSPADGSGSAGEADSERVATAPTIHWVADRVVSEDRVTGNHKCSDVPGAANPMACKTGYTIALTCDKGQRLTAPQLRCVEGDCQASAIGDLRMSPDGRRVEARFEVWGTPTRWQLTAVREDSVTASP